LNPLIQAGSFAHAGAGVDIAATVAAANVP
jgi:hypothetical protein